MYLPLDIVNNILSYLNYVDKLESLIVSHSSHYGYYEKIDKEIEMILKMIVYDPYRIKEAKTKIKNFAYVLSLHNPLPCEGCDEGCGEGGVNKYFKNYDYWKSFSMYLSWSRYH